MSLFEEALAPCPRCGRQVAFEICNSVNADRRPDLRLEIMAGTFQHVRCGACNAMVALPPLLTYLDLGRSQWILVKPPSEFADWPALEAIAKASFETSFGAAAPQPARKLAEGLHPRIVFGWPALREKLVAAEAGIDDVALELLKLAVMRRASGQPFGDTVELRLVAVETGMLDMRWLDLASEETLASMSARREVFDEMAEDAPLWEPLRQRLTEGSFVDVTRLLTVTA